LVYSFLPLYQFFGALGGKYFHRFTARRHLSPYSGWSMVIVNYCTGVKHGRNSVSVSFGISRIFGQNYRLPHLVSMIYWKAWC